MDTRQPHRWIRWPDALPAGRIAYGADYNPEQWPREVWAEDVQLMRQAGVNIVSLAIFSWARLQPSVDTWNFAWLDEVMDLMHEHGIAVDLATATASPPPWLAAAHPEVLPLDREGRMLWPGGRQHWRPTSPVFREHALALVREMARRYADHPALAAWHINNELGCHNVFDYSDDAAAAFRDWLRQRYATVAELNRAWATAFWSQGYSTFEEVLPPRLAASFPNPTQQLDFRRFSSDALKEHLRAERDVLRRLTPDVPITTNFMIMGETKGMDYADWAREVDFVSNDHYVVPGPQAADELSFSANLTRGTAGGDPWFLMEHSTSAVNWQPVNLAKAAGAMARDSLTHVAHGADAVCFFQWRQSAAGAERYHSAMVPHAGADSDVFRSVVDLGRVLGQLSDVAGSRVVPARCAILFDWNSWWASELDSHPTDRLRYKREALDWYSAFLALGTRADIIPAEADLSGYDLVVAPMLHVMDVPLADRLDAYVDAGGHLVVTYFSGIVDRDVHVHLGGYPGVLRDLLGIRVEEFFPLLDGQRVQLDTGTAGISWSEQMETTDPHTRVLASYADGLLSGRPAITRREAVGSATYVSTRLGAQGIAPVLRAALAHAGVLPEVPEGLGGAVEVSVRANEDSEFVFVINRTDAAVEVPELSGSAQESTVARSRPGQGGEGERTLAPREVLVMRRPRRSAPQDRAVSPSAREEATVS